MENTINKRRIKIFDTTLRDGAQTIGINLSLDDKGEIAALLDNLGVDYIEAGWPGANKIDTDFFNTKPQFKHATLVGFGMMARAGQSVANDPILNTVLNSTAHTFCLVGKSWDWHVKDSLKISESEHFKNIEHTLSHAASKGTTMFDAEHFFDGYKANPDFAIQCLKSAIDGGAEYVVLCDTNGGTLPYEVHDIVSKVITEHNITGDKIGIHTHDDTGNAVSNTIMAVQAGASLVQGTLGGVGERCGNANLTTLLPTFVHKMGLDCGNVTADSLKNLNETDQKFLDIIGNKATKNAPYVGQHAFSTKAGLHAAAQIKNPEMYEHLDPSHVGNTRHIMISNQSGFANIKAFFNELSIEITQDNESQVREILSLVEDKQSEGYAYDEAKESLELLARQHLFGNDRFFEVDEWSATSKRRVNSKGEKITVSEATVKVTINDKHYHEVSEGNGPVNALDKAFRKALSRSLPVLEQIELLDYHVDLPKQNITTAAFTRANIVTVDKQGLLAPCATTGVSSNVIDASVKALLNAYRWRLMRNKLTV